MFFKVGCDFLEQLVQGFEAEIDQKDEGVIQYTVLINFEDVFQKQSKVVIV